MKYDSGSIMVQRRKRWGWLWLWYYEAVNYQRRYDGWIVGRGWCFTKERAHQRAKVALAKGLKRLTDADRRSQRAGEVQRDQRARLRAEKNYYLLRQGALEEGDHESVTHKEQRRQEQLRWEREREDEKLKEQADA